jgi:hypothetical protein
VLQQQSAERQPCLKQQPISSEGYSLKNADWYFSNANQHLIIENQYFSNTERHLGNADRIIAF